MANRVSVNINVNDLSRRGLDAVRANLRRLDAQIRQTGGRITVTLNDDGTRAGIRRIQRAINSLPRNVRVRVNTVGPSRADAHRLRQRVMSTLTSPVRTFGAFVAGVLSDGIGQGILGAFRTAGPVGVVILAGIIAAAAGLIGAALAGALVLGFGGAFVAIGVMMAKESKVIERNWKAAVQNIKKDFAGAGEPLVDVVHTAIHELERLAGLFAPHFKKAMEEAAPHLDTFLGHVSSGIEKAGRIMFKPMMDAFNEFLDAFGPQFEGWLVSLGRAFEDLAQVVKDNKEEIALALRIVLELIPLAVRLVARLAESWAMMVRAVDDVISAMSRLWGWVMRKWGVVLRVTAPGLSFAITLVSSLWRWVNRQWSRAVRFTVPGVQTGIVLVSRLWGWANRRWSRAVRFSVPGVRTAIRLVSDLWGWVNRQWSKVVTFDFKSIGLSALQSAISALPGFAHGGIRGAATGGARSNMTLVGEQGPEIVNLAPGSRVRSNSDSRRIMSDRGGGGGGRTVVEIRSGGSRLDDLLIEILKRAVHHRGGDVQLVLGRN